MTISYRPQHTSAAALAEVITALGYRVEQVQPAADGKPAIESTRYEAPLPNDAPKFFRQAFDRARKNKQPIVIDFFATWCGPCIRLKKETLSDAEVAKRLAKMELIYVDVDQHPLLAKAYGVASVPDVFLIDAEGHVVDRLRNFEPPDRFLGRLGRLIGHERSAPATKKKRISP